MKPGYEDVFEALEDWLASRTGEASVYIWVGRSRNDHVSAALRLYAADGIAETLTWLLRARLRLIELASMRRTGCPAGIDVGRARRQLARDQDLLDTVRGRRERARESLIRVAEGVAEECR
jgi:argininosuccinate lyase